MLSCQICSKKILKKYQIFGFSFVNRNNYCSHKLSKSCFRFEPALPNWKIKLFKSRSLKNILKKYGFWSDTLFISWSLSGFCIRAFQVWKQDCFIIAFATKIKKTAHYKRILHSEKYLSIVCTDLISLYRILTYVRTDDYHTEIPDILKINPVLIPVIINVCFWYIISILLCRLSLRLHRCESTV